MKMMKISISGPLLLLLLILSGTSSVLGLGASRFYTYVDIYMSWQDSRNYCKGLNANGDLATVLTPEVKGANLDQYKAWVGLALRQDGKWKWDNEWYIVSWADDEPDDGDRCGYVSYNSKRLHGTSCGEYFFFICDTGSDYTFVSQSKTWSEARQYCADNGDELASIPLQTDVHDAATKHNFPIWIGLRRDDENEWQWAKALSEYRDWADNEPSDAGDCVSIYSSERTIAAQNCTTRLPFLCYWDNIVLVKEEKTWEEALEVCRDLGSPGQYDLASVEPGDDLDYLMYQILEADTDEVWSGLRFLAGSWMWVDGAQQKFPDLPDCPQLKKRCGAFLKNNSGTVEPRDCTERKNILCYQL
ncbi:macrophage mannose receptor 1-like [Mugil cephalus]|uniref:macrophage mannose receptor 1-like n=1 Tax=Mugil cephalus TaxID=48193 RepID=UPI001FB5A6EA|nr:macrophage mannose receptor 1-like [Mugil cephalus]